MSKENGTLVPIGAEKTSEQQKALMLLLNQQVYALFDQNDILLRPSPEMNKSHLWANLKNIRANQQAHVGYEFKVKIDVNEDGYFWLNVSMVVWTSDDKGGVKIAFLTPNQTHWICDRLKDNPLLKETLISYTSEIITNLRKGLDRVQETVGDGQFWNDKSKFNQVFDVVTGDVFRRGWYTSWDIFLENVCPPPPWVSSDPKTIIKWSQIMDINGSHW